MKKGDEKLWDCGRTFGLWLPPLPVSEWRTWPRPWGRPCSRCPRWWRSPPRPWTWGCRLPQTPACWGRSARGWRSRSRSHRLRRGSLGSLGLNSLRRWAHRTSCWWLSGTVNNLFPSKHFFNLCWMSILFLGFVPAMITGLISRFQQYPTI